MANELTNAINQQVANRQQSGTSTSRPQSNASAGRINAINAAATQAANNPNRVPQSYTISTTSGKQYTVDRNQMDWIKSRYKQDWAGTYGVDDADQYAYKNGQMSAKWRKTYGNSNVDRQLAEMGLPSEKNLEKYIGEYQSWHTGGMDQVFKQANLPKDFWTKSKGWYQSDLKNAYENTAEDQSRKRAGLMPAKYEAKYTDTEIDDELRARGLPPLSEFNTYANRYNNYAGIENFYANVARNETNLRLAGINEDDKMYLWDDGNEYTGKDLYAKAFDDELKRVDEKTGELVYSDIMPLFKDSTTENKNALGDDDYANYNAFSYNDYKSHYDDLYNRYFANQKTGSGQLVSDAIAAQQRRADAEAMKKYFAGAKEDPAAFAEQYTKDHPSVKPEEMFLDMFRNGVSYDTVHKTMKTMQRDTSRTGGKNRADDGVSGFFDISDAFTKAWTLYREESSKPDESYKQVKGANFTPSDVVGKIKTEHGDKPHGEWSEEEAMGLMKELDEMGVSKDVIMSAIEDEADLAQLAEYVDKYFKGAPLAERYKDLRDDMHASTDAAKKLAAEDTATIDKTAASIRSAIGNMLDESDAGVDVDAVLSIIDSVSRAEYTNPIAVDRALEDLGFSLDGNFFGWAADVTANWSKEDIQRLLFNLGDTRTINDESEYKGSGINSMFGLKNWRSQDTTILRDTDFSLALEWAQQKIEDKELTDWEAYQILAADGFQDEMEYYMPEEWHRAHFIENIAPGLVDQSREEDRLLWEEMTTEQRRDMATRMWEDLSDEQKAAMYDENWWKFDQNVYRTFGQALEQQFAAVLPGFAAEIIGTPLKVIDAIDAGITGRPEMLDATQKVMAVQQKLGQYGSVDDPINGAKVASVAADVVQELGRMYFYGSIGGAIGAGFAGTSAGSAVMAGAASDSAVVRGASKMFMSMVKSSPFVVSAFANNYSEVKELGASNSEATWFGLITGLSEGILEGFEFDELWGRALGQGNFAKQLALGKATYLERLGIIGKAWISSAAVSGLGEFTEESIGYVLETFLKMRHSDTWGKGTEWSASDWLQQAMMGFITGALGGGLSAGGSFVKDGVALSKAIRDNPSLQAWLPDILAIDGEVKTMPKAALDAYRKGGATVLSRSAYDQLISEIENNNKGIDNYTNTVNAIEASRQKAIGDAQLEVDKIAAKIAPFSTPDASGNIPVLPAEVYDKEFAPLVVKYEAAIRHLDYVTNNMDPKTEEKLKEAKSSLQNSLTQKETLAKKEQEHWAGLFLMNEHLHDILSEEMIDNLSRAYQNGATYDPSAKVEGKAAQAVDTKTENAPEANATTETTKDEASVAARESAYDRVYTDQEAGKAYGNETKNAKGRKLTRVEFAENERQNFQAKTTAKQGKVTLELAGLEAAEGMSDKEIIAEAKKAMTPDAAKKLDMFMKLSKALGMPMVIRDVVAGTSGYVHDGKLYVTLNGKQALLRVTAHEVTHWMKEHLPSGYDVLRTRLINDVGGQAAFDELVQKKAQEYSLDLSTDNGRLEADDEVCAELCEKMFENKDALEKFVNEAPEAAKTLKARLAKTLVAIKQAIKSLGTSNSETNGDLIKDQDTIELWYKTLSEAIDAANAEAKGKVQPTIEDVATETSTEAQPQAPPAPEGVEELGISSEEVRKQNLRSELEELAKNGTKVKDFDRSSVNEILDRVIVGDRTNYSKADYAQIRGMLAQLIPEIKAMVDGDTSVDLDALNERVQTALNYMLDRYSEPSAELYDLREIIPGKIALTETAYNELRKNSQMTLREASNRMTRALGKFVNFVYKGSPNYSAASTIDEVWRDIGYEPEGQGTIAEDADALIKYVEERAERSSYDDLYKSQREDMVSAHAGEFLDAVQSIVEGKNANKSEAARYTLDPVDPIEPTSDLWSKTATTTEAKEAFPDLWDVSSEESEDNNPTQRKSTESTYRKIYDILRKEGFRGKILDASSGMGYGTRLGREEYGFDVDDIEPYPGKDYNPMYKDYSTLNEKYDAIISSAVLNVLPQDQRDALVVKMGQLLNPGGKMYITTRGTKGDVDNLAKTGKNIQLGPSEFVETVHGSYQKGFTNPELKAYLEDALGPGFTVEVSNKDNGGKFNNNTSIVVTKNGSDVLYALDDDYMPLAEKYDAGVATEEETDRLRNIVAFAASQAGYEREAYHGTRSAPFTVFDRNLSGQNYGGYNAAGGGFDFTDTEDWARRWGAKANGNGDVRTVHAYLNTGKPFYSYDGAVDPSLEKYLPYTMTETEKENAMKSGAAFHKALEDNDVDFYDVMMREGYGSYSMYDGADNVSVYNPSQIKSADLVTYDDDHNIIPLSERFDPNKVDTRWAVDDDWDEAVRRYGAKPQGMNPRARDVQVPERLNRQSRLSDFLRSLTESGKVTDDQVNDIKKMVVEQNYMSYIPTSVSERMEQAQKYIAQRQPLQAQQEFHDMVTEGKGGANTVALGIQLLSDAAERGDIESVLDTAADLQILATDSGQSVQAFSVLKQLKGVGSAWYMQKLVDRLNSKYADRIAAGKMDTITVSPELMAQLAAATNVNEIEAAEEAVAKEIAGQLPLTWTDRLSNWRYFSMLANPVTHFRNIFGNVLMGGMNMAKDVVATGLERTLNVAEEDRAHAVLTAEDRKTWGDWAQKSYDENARNLRGGGKLGFETFVKQNMRSFDTKFLNALAKFNFDKLEGEDIRFIRPAYKNALMQYMKAQGYTLNAQGEVGKYAADGTFTPISNAKMTEAEEWASNQAWKATFRDASDLATMLNKVSKMNSVSRLLVEGVMPFKKTPINIAKRGIEYSPAGIFMGIAQLTNGVKKGKYTPAQAIDTLASGITGSALMTLGVFLAKLGVIRGGGEDKKKYETYLEDTGDQTYAFKIGDVSINMSSIAPATIPLFMGVALEEMLNRQGDSFDLSTFTDTIAGTLNPLMEMSFMSSLNSALQNYNNNGIGGALGNTVLTAAQNYGSQYLPTAVARLGQLADPVQRTTKSSATSPIGGNMDYYVRSLAKKVPGATAALEPDVNVWGQTNTKDTFGEWLLDVANKFVLPTNVKITNRDAVDKELIRLVESTGGVDFLPSDGNKYFTVSGQTYKMNARQYTEFSKERGEASYAAIKEVMNSPAYVNANDTQRADMLEKALKAAQKQVNTNWKYKLGAFD